MPKKINMGNHVLGGKVNLVTKSDGKGCYDIFCCENCGKNIRVYGIRRNILYPGPCYVSKARSLELMKLSSPLSKEAIVVGTWSIPGNEVFCPECKSKMILCPREGHPNSKYWSLRRDDGFELYVCPNGCLEK